MVETFDITGKYISEKRNLISRLEGVNFELSKLTDALVTATFERSDLADIRSNAMERSRMKVGKGGIDDIKKQIEFLEQEKKMIKQRLKNLPAY